MSKRAIFWADHSRSVNESRANTWVEINGAREAEGGASWDGVITHAATEVFAQHEPTQMLNAIDNLRSLLYDLETDLFEIVNADGDVSEDDE